MMGEFTILVLLKGEGDMVGFSSGVSAIATHSASDQTEYLFGEGVSSVSVPSRRAEIFGNSSSSSASVSISSDAFDLIGMVQSGLVLTGVTCEIRYFSEGDYWVEAPLLFSGVATSAEIDSYDGAVNISFGPNYSLANMEFPSSRVGDKGRFDNAPESTFGRVLPVVYGQVQRYPIPAVNFDYNIAGGGEVDVCVAAHPIYGSVDKPGHIQIGNNRLGDMNTWYEVMSGVDGLGGTYSYITVDLEDWDDGIYATSVSGKTSTDGRRMESLGDIALDLWMSYSGSPETTFDAVRSRYASERLNRFSVGMAFTDSSKNQTVVDIMSGRLGDLPLDFSSPIGLFGWDASIVPDPDCEISGKLHYGINIVSRETVAFGGYGAIQNRFKISFNYDNNNEGNTGSFIIDQSNSALCAESVSRYGESQYVELSAPDVVTPLSVGHFASCEIMKRAFPRLGLRYFTDDPSFISAPLLSVYEVTDEDIGVNSGRFFLEAVTPDINNGGCLIELRSIRSLERAFIRSQS